MGFTDQLRKLWDNWLIIVLVLVLLFAFAGGGSSVLNAASFAKSSVGYSGGGIMADSAVYNERMIPSPVSSGNFAPEVTQRKIIKTASMNNEIERGTFTAAEQRMKGIVSAASGFILNENSNTNSYDNDPNHSSKYGYYTIKVETTKYDSVIAQLKTIGEVKSFSENSNDITGSYTDLQTELKVEQERMARYQAMYDQATLMADKITLNDQMFSEQRTIEYLQNALKNTDQQVSYNTISFSMNEKQSDYLNVAIVKFSELIKSLVNSFNSMLYLIFYLLPYAVAVGIIYGVVRFFSKKNTPPPSRR